MPANANDGPEQLSYSFFRKSGLAGECARASQDGGFTLGVEQGETVLAFVRADLMRKFHTVGQQGDKFRVHALDFFAQHGEGVVTLIG